MPVEGRGDERARAGRGEGAVRQGRRQEVAGARSRVARTVVALWRLCEQGGMDLPGEVGAALQEAGRAVGGVEALVRSRPGSWEASDLYHSACSDAELGW